MFSLDAGIGRTFLWGDRLNLDWRMNATNVLNRVTYAAVNAFVGSPQFGLPTVREPDAQSANQLAGEVLMTTRRDDTKDTKDTEASRRPS